MLGLVSEMNDNLARPTTIGEVIARITVTVGHEFLNTEPFGTRGVVTSSSATQKALGSMHENPPFSPHVLSKVLTQVQSQQSPPSYSEARDANESIARAPKIEGKRVS